MGDSLQYTTVESSNEIVLQLLASSNNSTSFACKVHVSERHLDSVSETIKTIYIDRLIGDHVHLKMVNNDRVYDTFARLTPEGEAFEVNVTIHVRQLATRGATIVVSPALYKLIENYVLDQLGNE
jgi:hypothetical protein